MKTYLITGGAGFIGTNLTKELLDQGNRVIVLDNFNSYYDNSIKENNIKPFLNNPNYILYKGDIRNIFDIKEVLDNYTIDVIVHLASLVGVRPSLNNPYEYNHTNIDGTIVLLDEAKIHNINNIIIASSSSVYGNNPIPFNEDMETNNMISPYAKTKRECEKIAHEYHDKYDMNIMCLRFFSVYGPHQRPDEVIHKFVDLIYHNEEIPLYGDGTSTRDYTYVGDIVDGIIKSSNYLLNNKDVYEVLNIGSGNSISLNNLVELLSNELNINPTIKNCSIQPGDVSHTKADITKAYKLIGYKPKYTIKDGIHKYIKSYKEEHR